MISSQTPIRVLVATQAGITDAELAAHLPGGELDCGDLVFLTNPRAEVDVAVVLNYIPYDIEVTRRKGFLWVWDNEPLVRHRHPKSFDTVFTHQDASEDRRRITAPPALDWWVNKSYDELESLPIPEKTGDLSAIASTKAWKPGHQKRRDFVNFLEQEVPSVDVFGQGRRQELADKWDGLGPYRYSIAIENTSKADYWTEKISDCFLSFTVPLYFGATNIADYFPEDSYIWLPIDDAEEARKVIEDTLAYDNWEDRLPALKEARLRVLERYSLYGQVSALVSKHRSDILSAPLRPLVIQGRRHRKGGWIRGVGLSGNIKAMQKRRSARSARKSAD